MFPEEYKLAGDVNDLANVLLSNTYLANSLTK